LSENTVDPKLNKSPKNIPELFIITFIKMNYGNGGRAGMDDGRFDIDIGF